MGNSLRVSSLVLTFALATSGCRKMDTSANRAPSTAKRPVTDSYHGVNVVDDYRWLEDWNNPEVRQWSDSQNTLARTILNRLESRNDIRTRVTAIRTFKSKSYRSLLWRSGKLFAIEEETTETATFPCCYGFAGRRFKSSYDCRS
jgi:Prolyl oligopeptidase, N-terminal beta-propeller domain